MRRLVTSLSAAGLLLVGGVVAGSTVGGAAGQPQTVPSTEPAAVTAEATEAAASTEGHPLVGLWSLIVDPEPDAPPVLLAFSPHGTVESAELGVISLGVWEATGPTSGAMTLIQQSTGDEEDDSGGSGTIRATFEVDPDGQNLTGEYTLEFVGEGAPAGEYGPGTVTGTRIVVEPMGTPAGTLDDLFGGFEEGTEPASEDTVMVEDTVIDIAETTEAVPPTTS